VQFVYAETLELLLVSDCYPSADIAIDDVT